MLIARCSQLVLKLLVVYRGGESCFNSSQDQNLLWGIPSCVYWVPGAHLLGVEWLECVKQPPHRHLVLMLRISSDIYTHTHTVLLTFMEHTGTAFTFTDCISRHQRDPTCISES